MKNLIHLIFVIVFFISCKTDFKSLPISENTLELTTITQLQDSSYSQKIDDFYEGGVEGTFIGKDSISIYYKIFAQKKPDKAILISTGRTEAAIKYKELIFDLYQNDYSIYIHDHRGQGQSGRMTEDHDMGYVSNFQFYIDDMKYFYDTYVKPKSYQKIYLLTHSMGGAVGMTYLEQYPKDFDAAAFSSPMLGLPIGICTTVELLEGDEPEYVIGASKYDDSKEDFEGNTLTGSEIRFDRMIDAFAKVPEARLGGATYHWVNKSCLQFDVMFDNIDKIETPFILFSAENEQIVATSSHQEFIDKAKALEKNCQAYVVANAQHELFIEKDEQRIETINKTLKYFENY
ncbi:MAG: alpha/beta fold hydrolase [Urechidicola sp.]|nr:alpha/beta fold hydrolase [Urechidicola sp.]